MKILHVQMLDGQAAATVDSSISPQAQSSEILHTLRTRLAPEATAWTDNLSRHGWSASLVALNAACLLAAQSRELGLSTHGHPPDMAQRIIAALTPDVLLLDYEILATPGFLTSLSYKPKLLVGWAPESIPDQINLRGVDLILSPQEHLRSESLNRGARAVESFFVGASLQEIEAQPSPSSRTDVVFCGSYDASHRTRNQLLLDLSKGALGWHGGYSTKFFFSGSFDLESMPIGVAMHVQTTASRRARFDALIGAKVAIHAFSDTPQPDEFDPFIFEATATGAVVLTAHNPALLRFFQPQVEVETYNSSEEMIQKLRNLLDNEKYRLSLATAGQARSLREYSVEARMETLSNLLRKYLS